MALHTTPASMLKESLAETIEAAKFCSSYAKTDEKWGEFKTGGCLGYPAGVLLFSVIDTIGSYFRGNKTFSVNIDGKDTKIYGEGWEHFKILNSKYFSQNLSEDFIRALYSKFRSFLTHNSVLGKNSIMVPSNKALANGVSNMAFLSNSEKKVYLVSIQELIELCENAVKEFLKDIDSVVPISRQGKSFN